MLIAVWPLVFAVIGAVVYLAAANPKAAQLGLVTYGCGMFWLVANLSRATLELAR